MKYGELWIALTVLFPPREILDTCCLQSHEEKSCTLTSDIMIFNLREKKNAKGSIDPHKSFWPDGINSHLFKQYSP